MNGFRESMSAQYCFSILDIRKEKMDDEIHEETQEHSNAWVLPKSNSIRMQVAINRKTQGLSSSPEGQVRDYAE